MLKSYTTGFILSILLTLAAYFSVADGLFTGRSLITAIIGLALAQFTVQLLFFLHLGRESRPRWNLVVFISTASIILILVLGSLWIMDHLNYNMTPGEMNSYMMREEGIRK